MVAWVFVLGGLTDGMCIANLQARVINRTNTDGVKLYAIVFGGTLLNIVL